MFRDGSIISDKRKIAPKEPISEANCSSLYQTLKNCTELKVPDIENAQCDPSQIGMITARYYGIFLRAHPLFQEKAFQQQCHIACTTGKHLNQEEFSLKYCHG
jgi:hypothetical protein